MTVADVARLVALALIWSASFVFIRVLAPVLGPVWVATSRMLVAGAALTLGFVALRMHVDVRRHWRAHLFVGVLNSALPFLLFAYAALTLPASYLVILNAVLPMLAAIVSALWLDDPLDARKILGLAIGTAGVVLVSRAGPLAADLGVVVAIAASIAAVACYALAGVWLKRRGTALHPIAVAGWSQLLGGLALLPIAVAVPVHAEITPMIVANLLALALVCSAAAYVLYFRLIANVGPTRAMTVTFLMPAFGMMWGRLFLGETITVPMLAGAVLIVAGTAGVIRHPRAALRRASS